jgi:hypothetical protein
MPATRVMVVTVRVVMGSPAVNWVKRLLTSDA